MNEAKRKECVSGAACSTFEHLRKHNAVVHQIMRAGGTAEDCAVALSTIIDTQAKRIVDLEIIAPRKIKMSDGTIKYWRCPAHLIPDHMTITDSVMSNTALSGAASASARKDG